MGAPARTSSASPMATQPAQDHTLPLNFLTKQGRVLWIYKKSVHLFPIQNG
jgi:hypothetical protein